MKKNEILQTYGTDYKEMTKRLLKRADLAGEIPSKTALIGIKPNLLAPTPASYGATTHPEIVAGIVEYLQEHGFSNLLILEGAWVGDRTSESFKFCGYEDLSQKYGVPLWDPQKDSSHEKNCGGMKLKICDKVEELDFLINVPVLKGHCQTKITCALKNMKGLIPNSEKRRFHTIGLHKPIAHLGLGIHQDFIVVDNICGDLDFEEGGNPVVRNCIMAAKDPVLVDALVCRMLHYAVSDVEYVALAAKLGVGSADIEHAMITVIEDDYSDGTPGESIVNPADIFSGEDAYGVPGQRVLAVAYAADAVDSCSACYAALIPALDRLKSEGLLEKLDAKIAIGQGHRGKAGKLGVGLCTSKFDVNIPGCPPT
ncbi:MAG: DUF362 domain-containing protein, partial [Clostridiales bacterium]|nr:DUF362 domain-containing protein [Clostridiales bacterium]